MSPKKNERKGLECWALAREESDWSLAIYWKTWFNLHAAVWMNWRRGCHWMECLEKQHRKVKRTLWTSRTSERLSIVMVMVPVPLAGCCPEKKIVKEKVLKVGAPSEFPPLLTKIVCVPSLRMVLGPRARYIRTTKCTILWCLCTIWTKTKCRSPHLRFLL